MRSMFNLKRSIIDSFIEINLPNVVYMIVDKNTELETNFLEIIQFGNFFQKMI